MSSLYKRGNIWWISDYRDGCKSTGKRDKKEAEEFLKDFEARKRLNLAEPEYIKPYSLIKLSEGIEMFLDAKDHSNKTPATYRTAVSHLTTAAGDKYVGRYDYQDYLKLLNYFKSINLSVNSKASYIRHLRSVFGFFKSIGMLDNNIIKRIKPEEKEVKTIPKKDLDKIFKYLETMPVQYKFVKLSYLAALRLGEVISIEGDDFDLKNNLMYVRNTKGKRVDKIPLVKDLRKYVKSIHLNGKMFNYKSTDSPRTFWKTMNRKLGFDYTHHQLRKTRATELANKGAAPLFLQKFLRHKNIATTLKYYVNLDIDNMRKGLDKIL